MNFYLNFTCVLNISKNFNCNDYLTNFDNIPELLPERLISEYLVSTTELSDAFFMRKHSLTQKS